MRISSFLKFILFFCSLFILVACGQGTQTDPNFTSKYEQNPAITVDGKYRAKLSSLNSSVAGFVSGTANIEVIADHITVSLQVTDSPEMTEHGQNIYQASACPTMANDTNGDGFIDPVEAASVLGKIIVPLDGDLNSQDEGVHTYPTSNIFGKYNYLSEAFLSNLVEDLKAPDLFLNDEIAKLSSGEVFTLEGKVIVIQGVAENTYLPGSVQGIGMAPERKNLSIACGKIERIQFTEEDEEMGDGETH